jgi:hypothetical protein
MFIHVIPHAAFGGSNRNEKRWYKLRQTKLAWVVSSIAYLITLGHKQVFLQNILEKLR